MVYLLLLVFLYVLYVQFFSFQRLTAFILLTPFILKEVLALLQTYPDYTPKNKQPQDKS